MKSPHLKNKPPLKNEAPFQEMIPKENIEKSETAINTAIN